MELFRRVELVCASMDRKAKLRQFAKREGIVLRQRGKVILAPPCSGKSTYVAAHPDICDIDHIANEFSLHGEHYNENSHTREEEAKHYRRIDGWLETLKELGFVVLGSLYEAYVPDAIVIIDLETHRKYAAKRDDVAWRFASQQRKALAQIAAKERVPLYSTIDAAVKEGLT